MNEAWTWRPLGEMSRDILASDERLFTMLKMEVANRLFEHFGAKHDQKLGGIPVYA